MPRGIRLAAGTTRNSVRHVRMRAEERRGRRGHGVASADEPVRADMGYAPDAVALHENIAEGMDEWQVVGGLRCLAVEYGLTVGDRHVRCDEVHRADCAGVHATCGLGHDVAQPFLDLVDASPNVTVGGDDYRITR